jgi:hypothetical protein
VRWNKGALSLLRPSPMLHAGPSLSVCIEIKFVRGSLIKRKESKAVSSRGNDFWRVVLGKQ